MKAIGTPESSTIRTLAQEYRDVQTVTGTTMTLSYRPLTTLDGQGLELVFVNGALLTPDTDYDIDGKTITFASALTADSVVVRYPYTTT